ncbi:MAG: flagellar biosynthesis protein FlgL [Pseudomonadota bacterium]|nr:flagellar biosynthesis protein FlgL [Pseudomonadota bacterium]
MSAISIGDLASSFLMRSRATQLKRQIDSLTQEMATGQTSKVTERLGGDYSYLTDIDQNLSRLEGFAVATTETGLFLDAAQARIERMATIGKDLASDLLSTVPTHLDAVRVSNSDRAAINLEQVMSELNGSVAGRSIFGGTSTGAAPLASADDLLSALRGTIAGLGSATAIKAAAQAWFDSPGGFRAAVYSGSDDALAPMAVGADENVSMPYMADDPAFRNLLRDLALTALAADPVLNLSGDTQNELMAANAEGLLSSQNALAAVGADIGFAQAQVEYASVRNSAARTALAMSRNTLLEADPVDVVPQLEEAQFQLESLFLVASRTSQLSLSSFLR